MQLEVQVAPHVVADIIAGASSHRETVALLEESRKAGLTLHPRHPGTNDADLRTWFFSNVPPGQDAEICAALLRSHSAIIAVYSKPQDELP